MEGRLVRPWDSPLVLDYWWTLDIPVYYAEEVVKCCYWLRRVDPCGFVRAEAMAAMWCRSEILNFLLWIDKKKTSTASAGGCDHEERNLMGGVRVSAVL